VESSTIRRVIQEKLADGRLPHDSIPRVWGGAGAGEMCDACDEVITKAQFVMEGIGLAHKSIQFHVQCFYLWDSVRTVPGRTA